MGGSEARRLGGLAAVALFCGNLLAVTANPAALAAPVVWITGIVLAGRWRLFASIAATWPNVRLDRRQSWTSALAGGCLALVAVGALLPGLDSVGLASAAAGPWLLCYAAGKFGCHELGCCRAPGRKWSLPLREAMVSLGAAGALTGAHLAWPSIGVPVAAAGLHLATRALADQLRNTSAPQFDH